MHRSLILEFEMRERVMKPDPTVAIDWICCVKHSDVVTGHVSSFHLLDVRKVVSSLGPMWPHPL